MSALKKSTISELNLSWKRHAMKELPAICDWIIPLIKLQLLLPLQLDFLPSINYFFVCVMLSSDSLSCSFKECGKNGINAYSVISSPANSWCSSKRNTDFTYIKFRWRLPLSDQIAIRCSHWVLITAGLGFQNMPAVSSITQLIYLLATTNLQ